MQRRATYLARFAQVETGTSIRSEATCRSVGRPSVKNKMERLSVFALLTGPAPRETRYVFVALSQ